MTKDNGGPAFPHPQGWRRDPEISDGMSLRDWLAGQALAGFCANPAYALPKKNTTALLAASSFLVADAMLAERNKEPKP